MTRPLLDEPAIDALVVVPKSLSDGQIKRLRAPRPSERNYRWLEARADCEVEGLGTFTVISQRTGDNAAHYTVHVVFTDPSGHVYHLMRCGERPTPHTNELEGVT